MFCPKCSQKQVEDGLRFCSRCGFQLGVVRELLVENNDTPVGVVVPETRPKFFTRRKQDLTFGSTVMYLIAVIIVQVSWAAPKASLIFPLTMGLLVFLIFTLFFDALMRLARKFFSDTDEAANASPSKGPRSFVTKVNASVSALPPTQIAAASGLSAPLNTGEIPQPRSITEHTTDLLNKT